MKSIRSIYRVALACAITVAPSLVATPAAQTNGTPERFTAFAVNLGTPGPARAGTVEIVVNRWSPDAERDRLLSVLIRPMSLRT